jgi:hypothetical protein
LKITKISKKGENMYYKLIKNRNLKTALFMCMLVAFAVILQACSDNSVEDTQTDDEFIKEVITGGYSSPNGEDDDLMNSEANDLDDGGPVADSDGGDTPIDSLMKWGRRVTGVSRTVTITSEGDSIKNALITTNITGVYMIIGTVSGVTDTISKPYTEEFKRTAVFKRIARTPRPRHNWRLYKVSMLDGETKTPQVGTQYVEMNQLQVYINGTLMYTFAGPDFTQNIFTTRKFDGAGIPEVHANDQVRIVVNTYSTQSEQDIVAWHWGKRNFGFHREPFTMVSQTPNGSGWDRVYEKTFTIHDHPVLRGKRINGCISASTYKSLHDDSPAEFASDIVGTPYRVLP